MAAARTIALTQVLRPHVPLIKFRGGKGPKKEHFTVPPAVATPVHKAPQQSSFVVKGTSVKGSGVEAKHVSSKYKSKPLTADEIEIIQRGGADL
ncbi:uncharacterized protein LOC100373871 [Saccoglossus kowalevskii]